MSDQAALYEGDVRWLAIALRRARGFRWMSTAASVDDASPLRLDVSVQLYDRVDGGAIGRVAAAVVSVGLFPQRDGRSVVVIVTAAGAPTLVGAVSTVADVPPRYGHLARRCTLEDAVRSALNLHLGRLARVVLDAP